MRERLRKVSQGLTAMTGLFRVEAKMVGKAEHLGLYAEETGHRGEALGNFPQAFTHLALVSAAFNLDRALGPGR